MTIFLGILVAILLFSFIILIHEWGHFITARIFGVKVEEFGLGIPPRAAKIFTDKKGTLYSINWLPLGGFVRLKGENPINFSLFNKEKKRLSPLEIEAYLKNNTDIFNSRGQKISQLEKEAIQKELAESNAADNFHTKSAWKKAIILTAGVIMNFVLAFFIFFGVFLYGTQPIAINTKLDTNVKSVLIPTPKQAYDMGLISGITLKPIEGSIAEKSGIITGDVVTHINKEPIYTPEQMISIVANSAGKTLEFELQKGITLFVTVPDNGKIGSYLALTINDIPVQYGVFDAGKLAFTETKSQIILGFQGLKMISQKIFFPKEKKERVEAMQSMSGPIGIVDFVRKTLALGFVFLIIIGAFISISLGIFNLLPIPALDGGRLLFVIINSIIGAIFGKKIAGSIAENIIHFAFFVLLIALSIIIAYNDIIKIISNS